MANPRIASIRAAERTTRQVAILIGKLGTTDHPRGAILRAYRNAYRALKGNLIPRAIDEVLVGLRRDIAKVVFDILSAANVLGQNQAKAELAANEIASGYIRSLDISAPQDAWLAALNDQIIKSQAILKMDGDLSLLIGNDLRGGILQPGPIVREGSRWIQSTIMAAWTLNIEQPIKQSKIKFMREAIAAIDERTTDCCLRVHGQVVGLEEDFSLIGTPRFANKLHDPPFHWYCRTSQTLVRAEDANDELSQQMRKAAKAEIRAREEEQSRIDKVKRQLADEGVAIDIRARKADTEKVKNLRLKLRQLKAQVEIHPAHARSRR